MSAADEVRKVWSSPLLFRNSDNTWVITESFMDEAPSDWPHLPRVVISDDVELRRDDA